MKNLPAYLSAIATAVDDISIGFVLLYIHPFVAMPIWYGSALIAGIIPFLWRFKKEQLLISVFKKQFSRNTFLFLLFSLISGSFWMLSIHQIGISHNIIIEQSQYIILFLWAFLILKDQIQKNKFFFIILMCFGLILFTTSGEIKTIGLLFAIMTTLGMTFQIVMQKYFSPDVDRNNIVLIRCF